jgi:dTDP-4-dehydrorhamnose reductase
VLCVKVLLLGASGQVGSAVSDMRPDNVDLIAPSHAEADVGDRVSVEGLIRRVVPDLIINVAAYTAVDRAEAEPELAFRSNFEGPRCIAQSAAALRNCRAIHVSTDYVFDGQSRTPYRPEDEPNPVSIYGRSKWEGEKAVLAALPERSVVIRTAWVYAAEGRNFLLTMLRLMAERGQVRVVADKFGAPTAAASVARAIWRAAESRGVSGLLHWTDAGVASWYDFACEIAQQATALGLLKALPVVSPISTAEYPTPARRPSRSVLDLEATAQMLALTPLPWRLNVANTLREICLRGRV